MSYSVASIVRAAQRAAAAGQGQCPFPEGEEAGQIWAAAFADETDRRKKAQVATLPKTTPVHRVPAHIARAL